MAFEGYDSIGLIPGDAAFTGVTVLVLIGGGITPNWHFLTASRDNRECS